MVVKRSFYVTWVVTGRGAMKFEKKRKKKKKKKKN